VGRRAPRVEPTSPLDSQDGLAAHLVLTVVNPVVGLVGEQRVVRVATPGCESAIAGEEDPVVGVAHHAHQEGRHRIVIGDAVEQLATDLNQTSHRVRGPELEG